MSSFYYILGVAQPTQSELNNSDRDLELPSMLINWITLAYIYVSIYTYIDWGLDCWTMKTDIFKEIPSTICI